MPNKMKIKSFSNNLLFKWIIEHFPLCPKDYENSLDCPLLVQGDAELQVQMFPRGVSDEYRQFISLFVEMKNVGDDEIVCQLQITDAEDNYLASKKISTKPCKQRVEFGFPKFVSNEKVLKRIASLKCDTLIVEFYFEKVQSQAYPLSKWFARTLIGVDECSFTWFLENLDSNSSGRKIMYFPQDAKMEFNYIITQTYVLIKILKWRFEDNITNRDDDERDRDDDYGFDYEGDERSLVFKVSFSTTGGKKLMTHYAWIDFHFDGYSSDPDCYAYKVKKERLQETGSLLCEISVSWGTYLKHIAPKEIKDRKKSLK